MNKRNTKIVAAVLSIFISVFSLGQIVLDPNQNYFDRYYTEETYQNLERLYNQSQYRLKNPPSIIADEVVFRYASEAYIRGVDPILINSEHTPLGKYLIGFSYSLFQTESVVIVFFATLSLWAIWLLGKQVFGDRVLALIPVALFSTEELFRSQLRVTPLLDIIQLPHILLSLYFFIVEYKRGRFLWTSLAIGLAAATKSVVPAILLVLTFGIFFLIQREWKKGLKLIPWLCISLSVLMVSYIRTFMNGYTIFDFFGFQKWILLYQQSKLIFPFSFWRLMMLNQWQTWWGDMAVHQTTDWRITWPFLTTIPFVLCILIVRKKFKLNDATLLLLIWVLVYEAFLSLGVIVTRFLLPLIPILYILSVYYVRKFLRKS